MRALILAFAFTAVLGPGAIAAETPAAKDNGIVDVEMPAIFAPIIVSQRLEGYAYITVALTPAAPDRVYLIREKVPFLRDAFLRELNKSTIVKAEDAKAVDEGAVKARLLARMNQILPAGTVSDLKLEQVVMASLQAGN